MTSIRSIALGLIVVTFLSVFLIAVKKRPELEQAIDERITGFSIAVCGLVAGLAALYGLVRFIRWAWFN